MKTGILVIGSVGSGTRIATNILVKNGAWGDFGHVQRLDNFDASLIKDKKVVVIRRSIPHLSWADSRSSDAPKIKQFFKDNGFNNLFFIYTRRKEEYTAKSQLLSHRKLVKSEAEAFENIEKAKIEVSNVCFGKPYAFIYEELLAEPEEYQRKLCDFVGIELKNTVRIINGNKKYE